MFRRSSYASVAAGNSGQSQNSGPAHSGAFAHLVASNSGVGPQSAHPPTHHSRHPSRSLDADGHPTNSMSSSWRQGPGHAPYPGPSSLATGLAPHDGASSMFFVPSYLRGSKHAERLEEAHKKRLAAQREYRSSHSSNAGSLSTSSSSVNLHKMGASHRGMTHDIVERVPPIVEDHSAAPWPTRWNESDKYIQLELEEYGRQAKFAGSQKTHDEAASVRADYPMPRQCGIYYYEVTVVSKGKDGMIGVGFSGPKVALTRIPGWEPESYAYHGDDGQCFSNTTSGKPYGPKFGTLDVIGCGINFRTGTAFFTKNGHFLGTAFRDLKTDKLYHPTIGMKKPGETLRANFGQEPFAFDIDKMVQAEKAAIQTEIARSRTVHRIEKDKPPVEETAFIHSLVGQYLAHDGYVETARAFGEEVIEEARALANDGDADLSYVEADEDLDAINRQSVFREIRAAILEGDIDKALKHTNAYYPSVLRENENIYFKLRCRKFIEMIRRTNELSAQLQQAVPTPPSKRSTASNGDGDEYGFEMELDDHLSTHHNNGQQRVWETGIHRADTMDTEDHLSLDLDAEDMEARLNKLTQETIQYGQVLKQEFQHDPRREVKRALEDTFALIAYENVGESSLAPLLERGGRVPVAEELNGAILVSLGKSSSAALERLVQQTEALVGELADDGGAGAFINVRRDFLQQ